MFRFSRDYAFNLHFILFLAALLLAAIVPMTTSGCASAPAAAPSQNSNLLPDGVIAISRPVPHVGTADTQFPALGFMPQQSMPKSIWLSIDRSANQIKLFNGTSIDGVFAAEGLSALPPGTYQIQMKQKSPTWYAKNDYFTARLLPVPPENDPARYRRGALGQYALFVTKDLSIHSGSVWTPEVGGIKIDEASGKMLYEHLKVGSTVIVN